MTNTPERTLIMNISILDSYDIDSAKGIARCMNDSGLYEKLLKMFLDDTSVKNGRISLDNNNRHGLFENMHALKGVCGNLEINGLYGIVVPLVELLRTNGGTDEEISALFSKVEAEDARVREGIVSALK